jgi:HlyD family secretion protein
LFGSFYFHSLNTMPMQRFTPNVSKIVMALASSLALSVPAQTNEPAKPAASAGVKPALTVNTLTAQSSSFPIRINASGSVAAWQEASVGTEVNGLRLVDVKVNVGDVVKRGQVLAVFDSNTVQAELAQIRASVAEAEATLSEAKINAQRARELDSSGALSAQQTNQYLTAERTASARLEAQQALLKNQHLRLRQTRVLAPDNGIISLRNATLGAVLPAGQELFRLIRQGRLEWRAEVASSDLTRIKPGMAVNLTGPGGQSVLGRVRMVAPTVDTTTRNGLVYVDLTAPGALRAGMFARGDFELGNSPALTLPQSAVVLRDGFSYVYTVGENSKVSQVKVQAGRRVGTRIEILDGLNANARVVATGAGFLGDGDTVKVVDAAAPLAKKP